MRDSMRPFHLEPLGLRVMVPAFVLGYFVLSFLFVAHPFGIGQLHQWLGAIWQGFPMHVIFYQSIIAYFFARRSPLGRARETKERTPAEDFAALAQVYDLAYNLAAVMQLFTLSMLIGVKLVPELFPDRQRDALTFGNVFNPGPFYSTQPMASMASATRSLFLYDQYTGSAAALVWALTLLGESQETKMKAEELFYMTLEVLCWCVVAGPAGAVMRILRRRDQALLRVPGASEGKKSN